MAKFQTSALEELRDRKVPEVDKNPLDTKQGRTWNTYSKIQT